MCCCKCIIHFNKLLGKTQAEKILLTKTGGKHNPAAAELKKEKKAKNMNKGEVKEDTGANVAFSSPTRPSGAGDDEVITPFKNLPGIPKAVLASLSINDQRIVQASVFENAMMGAINLSNVTAAATTPQTGNRTKNLARGLAKKVSLIGGTSEGKCSSLIFFILVFIHSLSSFYEHICTAAKSALADGEKSDDDSAMSIPSSFTKKMAAKSQSSGSGKSEISFNEESMADSVASSSTTNSKKSSGSKMDASVASSYTTNSRKSSKSKMTEKECKERREKNAQAQKDAKRAYWATRSKKNPTADKKKAVQEASKMIRSIDQWHEEYIQGESPLPEGKTFSAGDLDLIEMITNRASTLAAYKEAHDIPAFCPEDHLDKKDSMFEKLEQDLYAPCKLLLQNHPGCRWCQQFVKFVGAPHEGYVLPPALKQAAEARLSFFVLRSHHVMPQVGKPSVTDFEKAFRSSGGEIPEGVAIMMLDDDVAELCKIQQCKENEAYFILSNGDVFKAKVRSGANGFDYTLKKQDDGTYEVVHAEYGYKGQVHISTMGSLHSTQPYYCVDFGSKKRKDGMQNSIKRCRLILLAFGGKDENPEFNQADHISLGPDKTLDDRFEHLRWADTDLQSKNRRLCGVVGPIDEWIKKMRKRNGNKLPVSEN